MKDAPKAVLLLGLCFLTWTAVTAPWIPLLDDTNLIFHEAGHVIFSLFGDLIYAAGGSIFQILLPLLLAAAFVMKREFFSALVCLWWGGENMIGVGRYIADARAQELDLLGGEHDWAVILARWPHVMMHDTQIGTAVRDIGIFLMLTSILCAAVLLFRHIKDLNRDSK